MNNEHILPRRHNTSLSFAMAPLYSAAIEMVESLQKRCDASLYDTAKVAMAQKEMDVIDTRNRMSFVPVSSNSCQDENALVYSAGSVDSNASFFQQTNNASSRTWTTPECRPTQVVAVVTILFDAKCEGKILVIDWTGFGKSHILRMIATFTGGVILVIVPLLALTANQMVKIEEHYKLMDQ